MGSFFLKILIYVGFILLQSVDSKMMFILLFAILNILQGLSSSSFRTAVYSALTTMYPDNVNFAVSCFETSSGIGFSFGPAIGSMLYTYGGYDFPLYNFLALIGLMLFMATTLIPSYLNYSPIETGGETHVSYFELLKNKRILFA
jgi:MFS family permease